MYYIIYKTTNLINGKYYIGKHRTKDLNDGYLGSGKKLKYAVKKYGIENFHREILLECSSEEQMNLAERILVVPDPINYNLTDGGSGGYSYINRVCHNNKGNHRKTGNWGFKIRPDCNSPEWKNKVSQGLKSRYSSGYVNPFFGKHHSPKTKENLSLNRKGKYTGKDNSMYGKNHSEETRRKISESTKKALEKKKLENIAR